VASRMVSRGILCGEIAKALKSSKTCFVPFVLSSAFFFGGCDTAPETQFVLRNSRETGIDFSNKITESDTFNIFTYDYIYNGGGVSVADFNNDGRQDIFFTGNMVPNKLFLNHGNFKFTDVTTYAKVNVGGRWNSGSIVVDINNDGWQDIYVCATMKDDSASRGNMLFINQGPNEENIPVFEESASRFGIAVNGFSLMAAFLDYDLDQDLDLYVMINQPHDGVSSNYRPKIDDGSSPNNDFLFRNNGNETFTDVSKKAGILHDGFGLGLAVADLNTDGWPDIYVSNDFLTNDVLYINNGNGTFTNKSPDLLRHQSQFSMGSDVADFNNDGLPDIITMDMLSETNDRKKTTINNKNYLTYINNEGFGYQYQYIRNMLQLNNGNSFSEIGQFAGVHQTEWSWSVLFADFDNDGFKDIAITNGYPKDITDKDFVTYKLEAGNYLSISQLMDSVPIVKIPNYAFRNNGDLSFSDVSKTWGFDKPSFSNGAAFVDLDNDGDLDYVVNNINEAAFVFENLLYKGGKISETHYVRIKLKGKEPNRQALGAKVFLYHDSGKLQFAELQLARGYLSSVEDVVHFGLGNSKAVDSVKIVWPDGRTQKLKNISTDQVLSVSYENSKAAEGAEKPKEVHEPLVSECSGSLGIQFMHEEDDRIDYNIQRTLPHKFSQFGPGVSVGDINGDGLDDFIIGGSYRYEASSYIQQPKGTFAQSLIPFGRKEKKSEDEGLLLFDADADHDLDLYIVSGSMEAEGGSESYGDRLYRNNGSGKFSWDSRALPLTDASGSCVRATDFDADGDLDLFVGGRVVPAAYPMPAQSYLLMNNGGTFSDETQRLCAELVTPGMVTDALWTDFDSDGNLDLVVVGEFMPITFFKNEGGRLKKITLTGIHEQTGWWNSLAPGDFDRDGDTDYIVGNLGLNNSYQVTQECPLVIYAKDFDGNGSVDPILGCYMRVSMESDAKKLYPVHFWDEINSQSTKFRRKYRNYKQYGSATLEDLLTPDDLKGALKLEANNMATSYVENLGNGKFKMTALPQLVQVAPVNGMVVDDVNNDGNLDVLMVGNDYGNEVFAGRYDAFTGLVLVGNGRGGFEVLPSAKSNFYVKGDAKGLAALNGKDEVLFLATQNRDSLKVFSGTKISSKNIFRPQTLDTWAELKFLDGTRERVEFYYGSGYLSQSTRGFRIRKNLKELIVHDGKGQSRSVRLTE
jgi:enediyne biosynthesis protein E4